MFIYVFSYIFVSMTFSEYTAALKNLVAILDNERENIAMQMMSDVMALMKSRVINERKDSDGQSFGTYSEAVVPYWYYKGKESKGNSEARANQLLEDKGYWASYQDWREVNNLTGNEINFSFTGEMWKSLQPVISTKGSGSITIDMVAEGDDNDKKLGYQLARFPQLLDLDGREEALLEKLNQRRLDDALLKAGLI
jgi:hypothetical protein